MEKNKMTEWRDVKLSDLISIKHGYAFKGEFFSEEETSYILVTPGNFNIGGGFKSDKFKWYNGEIPIDYILKKDDLIVTMTDLSKNGDTLGYSALVPELNGKMLLHNQRIGLVEIKSQKIDKLFLYWLMRTSVYQKSIVNTASGSTVKHTSPDRICQFSFSRPPLDIQRKIAGILGALDDKIEVLRAQNKTLEQMAQAVFQSWFVDFDIVRAKAAGLPAADVCKKYHITPDIYDLFPSTFSADNLPLGWEKKKLGDMVCNVKENIKAGRETIIKPYVPIDCISSKTLTLYESKSGEEAQSSLISFRQKDILFGAMRAYFHKVCIAPYEGTTRSTAFVLRPYKQKDLSFSLLSVFQKNCIDFASMNSKGSTMPYAVWDHCLSDYQTEASSSTIRDAFNNIVEPYLDKLIENSKQIRTLEQTRDTLLPQLISGKLDVENMTVPSVIDEV